MYTLSEIVEGDVDKDLQYHKACIKLSSTPGIYKNYPQLWQYIKCTTNVQLDYSNTIHSLFTKYMLMKTAKYLSIWTLLLFLN